MSTAFTRKEKTITAVDDAVRQHLDGNESKTFRTINAAKRKSRELSKTFGHGVRL